MIRSRWQKLSLRPLMVSCALLVLFSPSVANAYTIVMRDGRRIEIPSDFIVAKATLTYRVSAEIQVTMQLATIDVAATERQNGERAGTLLRHTLDLASPKAEIPESRSNAQRSITNRDLEAFRQARLESELAYERRRKELGLPSIEESRKQAAVTGERAREQLLSMRSTEQESENYWRSRASALRSDIAATDGHIEFVRARLNEISSVSAFGSFPFVLPLNWLGQTGVARSFPSQPTFHAPGTRLGARGTFGNGLARPQVFASPAQFHGRSRATNQARFPTVVALPFQSYDYSFERTTLISQLDDLLRYRAGLQSQQRELEEDARRAGAYPGWLRQ